MAGQLAMAGPRLGSCWTKAAAANVLPGDLGAAPLLGDSDQAGHIPVRHWQPLLWDLARGHRRVASCGQPPLLGPACPAGPDAAVQAAVAAARRPAGSPLPGLRAVAAAEDPTAPLMEHIGCLRAAVAMQPMQSVALGRQHAQALPQASATCMLHVPVAAAGWPLRSLPLPASRSELSGRAHQQVGGQPLKREVLRRQPQHACKEHLCGSSKLAISQRHARKCSQARRQTCEKGVRLQMLPARATMPARRASSCSHLPSISFTATCTIAWQS